MLHEQKSQDYLRELLFMLFARRGLIVLVTLLVFGVSVAVVLFSTPLYQATSSLLVRGKVVAGAVESLNGEGNKVLPVRKEDLYSEVELLSSTELMRRVAQRLIAEGLVTDKPEKNLVEQLRNRLNYEVLPATNVIKIGMTGQQPSELVTLIDTTLEEYVTYRLAVYQPARSLAFFERQANRLRAEILELEDELVALVASENTPEPMREIEANLLTKRDLDLELSKVQARLIELRSTRFDPVEIGPPEPLSALRIENPELQLLQSRRVELQLARGELLRTYQRRSEKVRELGREMAENERLIDQAIKTHLSAIEVEIKMLEEKERSILGRIEAIGRRNLVLQEANVLADRLRSDLALKQTAYENFVQRREEARMTETLDHNKLSSHVTVMERAWSSTDPIFPRPAMLPLGLITGLILGMMLALMREFLDHSFKKPSDLERISEMPVIGSVPLLPTVKPGAGVA